MAGGAQLFLYTKLYCYNMCTYIVYHDPDSNQPLVMATTREDSPTRPTSKPFLWDKAEYFLPYVESGKLPLNFAPGNNVQRYVDAGIVAQQDGPRGGTFLGTNKHGLMVAVNNRENNIPFPQRRSRGAIVLDALTFTSAQEAVETLYPIFKEIQQNGDRKYPGFNLIIADDKDAYVIINGRKNDVNFADSSILMHEDIGNFTVALAKIPPRQVSFVAGYDINDLPKSTRTQKFLPLFQGEKPGIFGNTVTLPQADNPASWGGWLSHLVHRHEDGNPFDYSIAQPNPTSPGTIGKGDPEWVTIGTNLLVGDKTPQGLSYDWLSMDNPPREGRMQALNVTPQGNIPVELVLHADHISVKPHRAESARDR